MGPQMKLLQSLVLNASLVSLLVLASCTDRSNATDLPQSISATPELHIIGIYEGNDFENDAYDQCVETCRAEVQTSPERHACRDSVCQKPAWPSRTAMNVPINVSRPGHSVSLVLGAYDAMRWDIIVDKDTKLNDIILIGYGADEGSATVNGQQRDSIIRYKEVRAPHESFGENFRALADDLVIQWGFDAMTSFQGGYRAPDNGFRIDGPIRRPEFAPNYLDSLLEPASTLIEIQGAVKGQIGRFRTDGTLIDIQLPIQTPKAPITSDGRLIYIWSSEVVRNEPSGNRYRRSARTVKFIRVAETESNRTIDRIPIPEDADLGHFKTMALDEKRGRLLLIFQAGAAENEIYSVDLQSLKWDRIGSTGRNVPDALFYNAPSDEFFVSGRKFAGQVFIGRLSPNGAYSIVREIAPDALVGMSDLYDPGNGPAPNMYVLGAADNILVLATDGRDIFTGADAPGPLKRIYEIDLTTGKSRLTFYE